MVGYFGEKVEDREGKVFHEGTTSNTGRKRPVWLSKI